MARSILTCSLSSSFVIFFRNLLVVSVQIARPLTVPLIADSEAMLSRRDEPLAAFFAGLFGEELIESVSRVCHGFTISSRSASKAAACPCLCKNHPFLLYVDP
jgi:hypothetical protein